MLTEPHGSFLAVLGRNEGGAAHDPMYRDVTEVLNTTHRRSATDPEHFLFGNS